MLLDCYQNLRCVSDSFHSLPDVQLILAACRMWGHLKCFWFPRCAFPSPGHLPLLPGVRHLCSFTDMWWQTRFSCKRCTEFERRQEVGPFWVLHTYPLPVLKLPCRGVFSSSDLQCSFCVWGETFEHVTDCFHTTAFWLDRQKYLSEMLEKDVTNKDWYLTNFKEVQLLPRWNVHYQINYYFRKVKHPQYVWKWLERLTSWHTFKVKDFKSYLTSIEHLDLEKNLKFSKTIRLFRYFKRTP